MLPLTSICPALVLLFLAGWVHRDISTGNIIVVENGGSLRGLVSDFEHAKATSTQGSSPDPKTVCFHVKNKFFLTFDQGTPYFMPLEIHLDQKYIPNPRLRTEERKESTRSDVFSLPELPEAILRYTPNHDQESLMWVALWIVYGLVDYEKAKEIWPQIFANTRFPTRPRENFFLRKIFSSKGSIFRSISPWTCL